MTSEDIKHQLIIRERGEAERETETDSHIERDRERQTDRQREEGVCFLRPVNHDGYIRVKTERGGGRHRERERETQTQTQTQTDRQTDRQTETETEREHKLTQQFKYILVCETFNPNLLPRGLCQGLPSWLDSYQYMYTTRHTYPGPTGNQQQC